MKKVTSLALAALVASGFLATTPAVAKNHEAPNAGKPGMIKAEEGTVKQEKGIETGEKAGTVAPAEAAKDDAKAEKKQKQEGAVVAPTGEASKNGMGTATATGK
ncbi:MAG: hypothetical protein PHY92_04720 [Alphaproteobacteria bacterium]|nr:hypothetical protein [Alphaproteobacteria bacterium]